MIIWLLGFSSRISPFTVFVLKLAIADLEVLLTRIVCFFPLVLIEESVLLASGHSQVFQLMCMASEFLLTAISLNQCLAFLLMEWHCSYQPGHFSIIIYSIILLLGVCVVFPSIPKTASLVLFVKGCSEMHQFFKHTLLMVILITFIISLLFALPFTVISMVASFEDIPICILELSSLVTCLNSSVNPIIYFWGGKERESKRMSSFDYERDPLFSSGDSSGDYHKSSGLSTLITDMNFYNKTNKTFDKEIPMTIQMLVKIWPEVNMLYVTWSEHTRVNIFSNNTRIVEIASNMSKISEIFSSPYDQPFDNLTQNLLYGLFAIICIVGLLGNGMTIYLLANCIKRNPFTTFILNLSIADFGVLTSLIMADIFVTVSILGKRNDIVQAFFFLFLELFFFTYSASQFLLTAISLDRCVAVLFPLWHRCHRPPYLPTLVCVLIWILSFLLSVVHFILHQTRAFGSSPLFYQLIVNGLLCTPLMVVSTVTLLIHMRSKLQLNQRKLLTVILLALLFFLLFSLPMNLFYVIEYFGSSNLLLMTIGMECAALNSSINPLLYFLVGRKKRGKDQPRASLKLALQRVFKDEQDSAEEQQTTEENI
ncbi:hypothetical protein E2320_011729, partial [Naja naja]